MVAIKILQDFHASDKKLWNLVVKKAMKFIALDTGLGKSAIDAALGTLKPMYNQYKSQ